MEEQRYNFAMSPRPTAPPPYRQPLSNSTNDHTERVAVASAETIKTKWPNTLRHKTSTRALHPQADSSESLPSSHSSIVDALCCISGAENDGHQTAWFDTFTTGGDRYKPSPSIKIVTAEHSSTPPNPIPHSMHHPTPLSTIAEQRSIATLHPQHPLPPLPPRRQLSFSLDDLALFRHRPSRLFKNSSSSTTAAFPPSAAPTSPAVPPTRPLPRPPTPPGLPSFNTPAAVAYRLPRPHTTFRDHFRRRATSEMRRWRFQTAKLPRGVLMRGEDGTLVRGRWRPSQSGYTGNARLGGRAARPVAGAPAADGPRASSHSRLLARSDLMRRRGVAPVQRESLQDVGGLLSGGRGAEAGRPDRPDGEAARRPSPSATVARAPGGEGTERVSKWAKVGEAFCYVCCGVEKADEGDARPRLVTSGMESDAVRNAPVVL